jgi:hypothetical protein
MIDMPDTIKMLYKSYKLNKIDLYIFIVILYYHCTRDSLHAWCCSVWLTISFPVFNPAVLTDVHADRPGLIIACGNGGLFFVCVV